MPTSSGKKSTTATKRRKGSANTSGRQRELETVTSRFANTSANHPKPARPTPAFGTFSIGNLKFLNANISVCYGCQQTLKPQKQIPAEPEDLVIVSMAKRSYWRDGELVTSPELSNVYYHLNPNCVGQKSAFFLPSLIQVPDDLKPFLQQSHIRALRDKLNVNVI
jgi:hypothetical protein